jgi:hypothetical protein
VTPEQVCERVAAVAARMDDAEGAHLAEDAIYTDVLRAIADGHADPAALAVEALKAEELDYGRWYA